MATTFHIVLVGMVPTTTEIVAKVVIASRPNLEELNKLNETFLAQRKMPIEQCTPDVQFIKGLQFLINKQHPDTVFALERLVIEDVQEGNPKKSWPLH